MGKKKKKNIFFSEKKIQNGRLKKIIIFKSPNSQFFFRENFRYWSLGLYNELMQRALMVLNLFGRQAVQHKDNLLLKVPFLCF